MKKTHVNKLAAFDTAAYLTSETAIAAYLTDIIEANDPGLLADALGTIARTRGMSEIANETGIGRTALYKALRSDSAPRFDTINKVCQALGLQLIVQPQDASIYGVPDEENPELTANDFKQMRPLEEFLAELNLTTPPKKPTNKHKKAA
ncbi:probable addiction module antidote protein [Methylophilus rhizosphaerae]|uniref:Probable addiction module antidote protein n=1 Tax=Methylophilus rhizosphaerae TaxID=492660 RepID=A0A1G8ZGL0_9PROT|nr:addiction module antidote protein [Methylophilus rhizosphaerae]SDK14123.1 probable addiction module antidote protein [Methylophilus rhizosphaerae]